MVISVNYGFGGGVMTVANAKSSPESEKFAMKIISESGILLTMGCHFPSKSTNFGTLDLRDQCIGDLPRVIYRLLGIEMIKHAA